MKEQTIHDQRETIPAEMGRNGRVMRMSQVSRRRVSIFTVGEIAYVNDRRYINGRIQPSTAQYPLDSAPDWIQRLAGG